MPSFANVLLASITDIDKNRIVESFGIKKGIELRNNFKKRRNYDSVSSSQKDNSYAVVRHERGFYYVQRRKSLSGSSAIQQKCKNDLRKTRKNNAIYRKKVANLETKVQDLENSNSKLSNEKSSLETVNNRIRRELSNSKNRNSLLATENSKLEDDLESQVLNFIFLPFELIRNVNIHFDLNRTF